jgi:exonuclease III
MTHYLRIATWNANGLAQRISELEVFLNIKKIDICLISESHFTITSYAKIRGYQCYQALHPAERARGGTAIFIKDNIKHHEELKIEEEAMQVATISIETKNNKRYSISAIYCPPRYNPKKEDYIKLLKSLGNNFIIGGDFNAKHIFWGSNRTTPKGRELFEAGRVLKCEFHSSRKPTYWPTDTNKIPDLLDFYITRRISENYLAV